MKTFVMNDLRQIINQLDMEEISMSRALEVLNTKAEKASKKAFETAWRRRMNCKGSDLDAEFESFVSTK